jgi:hypothetical protein
VEKRPLNWCFAPFDALPATIAGDGRRLSINAMKLHGFWRIC